MRQVVLLRLSGPSGSGKSRLIQALRRRGVLCRRAVLATSRPPRDGEVHGLDYYFLPQAVIAALSGDTWLVAPVHDTLQGVDLSQLETDLTSAGIVLIEIYHELWPELVARMTKRLGSMLRTESIFMTALDPSSLRGLSSDAERAGVIRTKVEQVLLERGKDSLDAIEMRS